jgi:hypothetical protein
MREEKQKKENVVCFYKEPGTPKPYKYAGPLLSDSDSTYIIFDEAKQQRVRVPKGRSSLIYQN